jgi:hypothetical protein
MALQPKKLALVPWQNDQDYDWMPNNGDARTIVAGGGLNWMYVSPSEDGPGQVGVIDHLTTMWRRSKRVAVVLLGIGYRAHILVFQ